MTMTEARERAARIWCQAPNNTKVMDPELAEAFADDLLKAVTETHAIYKGPTGNPFFKDRK